MPLVFTRIYTYAAPLAASILLVACNGRICHELAGRWSNLEGQEMIFQPDGKALWLTRFGSQYDTVLFEYSLDCKPDPATVELTQFYSGPFSGKTLYGILEWTSDTSFRMRYESGMNADVRPKDFDAEETMKFVPARSDN